MLLFFFITIGLLLIRNVKKSKAICLLYVYFVEWDFIIPSQSPMALTLAQTNKTIKMSLVHCLFLIRVMKIHPIAISIDQFILHYVQIIPIKTFIQYVHIQINQYVTTAVATEEWQMLKKAKAWVAEKLDLDWLDPTLIQVLCNMSMCWIEPLYWKLN